MEGNNSGIGPYTVYKEDFIKEVIFELNFEGCGNLLHGGKNESTPGKESCVCRGPGRERLMGEKGENTWGRGRRQELGHCHTEAMTAS